MNSAKAQEYAAEAAEAQGVYNAQIDVNNARAAADQEAFNQSAAEANKYRDMEANQKKRTALSKQLNAELAKERIQMTSSYGTFEDTFRSYEMEANNRLASFDFDASESSYQYNLQSGEAGRKRNLAWDQGLAQRELTLASSANQATQLRNQASNTRLGAYGSLIGGIGQAAYMGSEMKPSAAKGQPSAAKG
jgi:hypothetical protein